MSHYARGEPGDPTAPVENEDYIAALVRFSNGARGSLEGWRTACGSKSDMGFELYCTNGSVKWSLESLYELQVFVRGHGHRDGYTQVLAGAAQPEHGRFIPGDGNQIGFEETNAIEPAGLLRMIRDGTTEPSGFGRAAEVAALNAAVLCSSGSGSWEDVSEP